MIEETSNKEYTVDDLVGRLLFFRDDYKDEIPPQLVHSNSPDSKYKIRSAWMLGLAGEIEVSRDEGILPESVRSDVDDFLNWVDDWGKRPGNPPMNIQEDIEKGNEIIDKVLESLGITPKKD